jgi:hypothetical protein
MTPATIPTIFRSVVDGHLSSTTGPTLREFSGALPWSESITDDPVTTSVHGPLGRTEVRTLTAVEAAVIRTAEEEDFDLGLIRDEDLLP